MVTDTKIVVDGREIAAETVREKPPARDYLVVKGGEPEAVIRWDGETPYDPGDGAELARADEWKGPAYVAKEPAEERARRTRGERVDALAARLDEDIRGWDALGAPARAAATLRAMRLLRAVVRALRDDLTED